MLLAAQLVVKVRPRDERHGWDLFSLTKSVAFSYGSGHSADTATSLIFHHFYLF